MVHYLQGEIRIRIHIYSSRSSTITVLILATIVSFIGVAVVSIPHQVIAKLCISTISNNNNAGTTCNLQQSPNNDDHSAIKDKTPFLLAIPFP